MRLAVFTKNRSNPAYAAARLGAERTAARFGAEVAHFVPETPDDPVQQTALVHEALRWGPDAFVFTPAHPTRVDGAIAAIRDARVPIFGFVNRMADGAAVSYVGSSDGGLAHDVTEFLVAHLGGYGDVVVVEGPPDSITSQERVQAFEAAAERHAGIHIVGRCCGSYLREPAREAFAALLPTLDRVDAVFAANDVMALGALDALDAAGRGAAVVGVNAIPEAIDAIREGRMLATADFNAMQMCALATECAIRHLSGEPVPPEIELPVSVVERSNCAQWDRSFEQRSLATLDEVMRR